MEGGLVGRLVGWMDGRYLRSLRCRNSRINNNKQPISSAQKQNKLLGNTFHRLGKTKSNGEPNWSRRTTTWHRKLLTRFPFAPATVCELDRFKVHMKFINEIENIRIFNETHSNFLPYKTYPQSNDVREFIDRILSSFFFCFAQSRTTKL